MKRFSQIFVGFIFVLFFFVLFPAFIFAADSWTITGAFSAGRNSSTATVLESGKVLVNGGETTVPVNWVNLYNPSTGVWSLGPGMLNRRSGHTSTLLLDGRVLVAGGEGTASYIQTVEIYNPAINSWTFAPPMNSARFLHTATLLNDGRVLVAGGFFSGSAITDVEIFDPIANTWISVASLPVAKRDHTATLLPDGKVLIAGGSGLDTSTFVYDPVNNSWSAAGSLSFIRNDPAAILLNDGSVLLIGGTTSARCSAEIWSSDINQWTIVQQPIYCREAHSAIKLSDGTVFIIGGFGAQLKNSTTGSEYLNSTEIYDPVTSQWTATASMINPRANFPSVMLKNGTILAVGGVNHTGNLVSSEIYSPNIVTPTPTPTPTLSKTPLILIPGIGGSEFKTSEMRIWSEPNGHGGMFSKVYPNGEKVWVNNIEAVKPGEDDYFDVLRMQADGQTSEANLTLTGNLFEGYQETVDFFVSEGYVLDGDFFVFPYDWRRDVALTALLLDQKIESIKQQTGSTKVDIVAHSMGGLAARNYISDPGKAQNVRKLFTLGTPHLGSPDYIKNLMHGGCLSKEQFKKPICFGVSPSEVKDIVQNMISGFELAPSQAYFNFYSGEDNNHPYPYRTESGTLNYSQIKNLLTGLDYNTALFNPSETFHSIDTNLSNTNGVEVTVIAGSGLPTLGQIIEEKTTSLLGIQGVHKDILNINGDKTVPLFSASLIDYGKSLSLLGDAKVFYTKQEHGGLVSPGSALNLVKNILNNDSQLPSGASITPYSFSGASVSVHSPVNIHAYDMNGNHTGPTMDGDFEANIPGSSYDTLDDAKFIWLPDDGQYDIKFEATDQGSFDFKIRKYDDDENTETVLYNDIPLTDNAKAETIFDTSGEHPILLIDEDGNGTTDFEVNPDSVLTGDAVWDQMPPETTAELSGTEGLNEWYKSDVIVTLIPQDEGSGSGILKTEYSLDNGQTVNIYTEPFTISAEKINKLKYRSIDNAGNEENPKELEIKVDKTPPEARIFVDQDKQDVVVEGIDKNQTGVEKLKNTAKGKDRMFYLITDQAGNILKLDVKDRDEETKNIFKIYSIQYNQDLPIAQPDNHYNIIYKGRKNKINVLEQNFGTKINIKYDSIKDQSAIITRINGEEKIREIRNGLVLLQILTEKGTLRYTIYE